MFRAVRLFLIAFFLVATATAQYSLKGKVTGADSHQPIAGANVFLSNTSVGVITNANGDFEISHFPTGRYDLIVSFIGYETFRIQLNAAQLPALQEITLHPNIQELKEVVVESYDKNGWEKWGHIFMENFMGNSAFAADCKLVNKDDVHFHFDKKRNTIRVTADDQLVIENNALGYILRYSLGKFEYNMATREFLYQGYPYFEEMQTDRARQLRKWTENRKTAYYGSIMHFMRSVFRNSLEADQFEVRKLVTVSEEERNRVKTFYKNNTALFHKKRTTLIKPDGNALVVDDQAIDSLNYFKSVMEQPDRSVIVVSTLLNANQLGDRVDSFTVGLTFPNVLQVIYRPRKAPIEYQHYLPKSIIFSPVISEIYRLNDKFIDVLPNGSFFDGNNLMTVGYWSWWEKMCTKLPYDYWPPIQKK